MVTNPLMHLPLTAGEITAGKKWYPMMTARLQRLAAHHGVPLEVAAAMMAATSPGMKPQPNFAWVDYLLTTDRDGDEAIDTRPDGLPVPYSKEHIRKAMAIRDTGNTDLLSGPKVTAFFANLMGHLDVVTLDTWAVRPWGIDQAPKGRRREAIVAAYEELADYLGMEPAEAQATVWVHLRGRED